MSIITTARLAFIINKKLKFAIFDNLVTEARTYSRKLASTTVFLCHAPEDAELAAKAAVLLRDLKVKVFIDWMDPVLSPFEGIEAASAIKKRIKECDRFILLATENALASTACNWALGIADATKDKKKLALLPISEKLNEWSGEGYFQTYPRIEEGNIGNENFKIIYPGGSDFTVAEWFKT